MSSIKIEDLQIAIQDALREYGDVVYHATEKGLNAAENVLIEAEQSASPADSGKYKKSWKSKKKYKLKRYVGNTKVVKSKKSDTIPLSNILEYSEKSKHQGLIKKTFENNMDKMAAAVVAEIKKEA